MTEVVKKSGVVQKPCSSPNSKRIPQNVTIKRSDEIIAMAALSSIGNVATASIDRSHTQESADTASNTSKTNQSNDLKTEEPVPNVIYVYDGSKLPQIHGRIEKASISGVYPTPHNITVLKDGDGIGISSDPQVITPIANQMVVSKEVFKCGECKYSTHNRSYLKQHVDLIHNAVRLYKCPFCDYAGKRSHSLREHLIVHSNERPFTCPHCNATFRKKGHLTNHEKLHKKSVKCPICTEWFQSSEIEKHMLEKHNARKFLLCDICKFMALDVPTFNKHMESHHTTDVQKKQIVCSSCKTMCPDYDSFLEHAKLHENELEEEPKQDMSNTPKNVMIKCSECGIVTSDQESMRAHMWVHINPSLKKEIMVPEVPEKTIKHTAYKCLDCDFTCEEAKVFVAHMVQHKPDLQNIMSEPKKSHTVLTNESQISAEKSPTKVISESSEEDIVILSGSSPATKQQIEKYLAEKFSRPTVEKEAVINIHPVIQQVVSKQVPQGSQSNVEHLPFVHDQSNAKFRCTICGYTCDHQRTIKAHIWKHSGNKDIEYPMFRNGPLSVYEDMSVSAVMKEYVLPAEKLPASGSEPDLTNTVREKQVKMAVSPVAPALASMLAQRAKQKPEEISKNLPQPEKQRNKVKNVDLNVRNIPGTDYYEINICTKNPEKMEVSIEQKQDIVQKTYNFEDVEMHETTKQGVVDSRPVVVESVDTLSSLSTYTGMRSGENSPKSTVPEDAMSEDQDSGVVLDSSSQVEADAMNSNLTENRKISKTMEIFHHCSDELQTVECVVSSGDNLRSGNGDDEGVTEDERLEDIEENAARESSSKRTRTTSVTTESAVTLLSLLQKGPNNNPACPVKEDSQSDGQPKVKVKAAESEGSKKGGISSSLLAVIEQLRERSKERESLEDDSMLPQKRGTKRKIKRESEEDISVLESMDNVEKTEDSKYRCKLCHYSHLDSFMIRQHMRLHKEKKPFECSLCEFIAVSSEDLQDHMIKHCKVRTYQCKLCSSAFNYKSQLRAHMRAHNDKDIFVCDDCDYESNNPVAYRNHVRGHAEKKLYKCEVCENRFVSKHDLRTHKKLLCGKNRSFSCDECDFVAIGPQEQRTHAKVHNKEFKCAKCEYVTTSITRFQSHTKTHDEEPKSLKCELCDFPAVSSRSLKSHMKRHINDQRFVQQPLEQYKCNLCGYVCHHLPSLKSHMWRHASDTNYSYEFTNEVINAAIDYDCQIGNRDCQEIDIAAFFNTIRQKLKERLRKEKTETDNERANQAVCWVTFRCCQCGFETINKAELNLHMKSHSDVIQWTLQVPKEDVKKL
ncbi:zinc finger protein 236-like [Saccostrea echinata]|uniref:zinc finger protein 236-like n=1 Tax=Saccostrea echinata TaxID=191078 RepID=UPI002A81ED6B|nr:zinc finger protein 236-like [Saccostrea echinata]